MSIFDPHQLYVHHTKSTRKGQVIQKKPIPPKYAMTREDINHAIERLRSIGYHIYPKFWQPYYSYVNPFNISQDLLETNTQEFTFNSIWKYLVPRLPNLQAFIDLHPSPNSSHVAIAITSAIFFIRGGHVVFKFYNDGIITINSGQSQTDTTDIHAYLYGPNINNANYYLAYDENLQSTAVGSTGNIVTRTRSNPTDLTGLTSYCNINDKWVELNSTSGLSTEDNKILIQASAPSESSTIVGYIIQGYVLAEINN